MKIITNTLVLVSEDCPATVSVVPEQRNGKPTIASIEYEMLITNPYTYTEAEIQFHTFLVKQGLVLSDDERLVAWDDFFSKPHACFRSSPLTKRFGWGFHYDKVGKVAIYPQESVAYRQLLTDETVGKSNGMRNARKK